MARPIIIDEGETIEVEFIQGASVERNVFYLQEDKVTPVPDLETYTAHMDLREFPDDENAMATLTSQAGHIGLSSTGLIVWEIPPDVSYALSVSRFYGDLFIHAPDGDAIAVCRFKFKMQFTYTHRTEA